MRIIGVGAHRPVFTLPDNTPGYQNGNVYLAAEQVLIYSPKGTLTGRINVPERSIDLIFGGSDRRKLYILTHTSLDAVQTKTPGI